MWPFRKRERRAWPRYTGHLDVLYGTDDPLTLTRSLDICEAGMAFRATQHYVPGTRIQVHVLADPSDPHEGWMIATALVVRCAAGRIGVQFTSLTPESEAKLKELLKKMEESVEHARE